MKSQQEKFSPKNIALIGNIIILTFLPINLYLFLIIVTGDVGGFLNLICIPIINFIASILFTFIFFSPLSKLIDWILQKKNLKKYRNPNSFLHSFVTVVLILGLIIGVFLFSLSAILEIPFTQKVLVNQDHESVVLFIFQFFFLGGLPFLLGGFLYRFLLQLSRELLFRRKQ